MELAAVDLKITVITTVLNGERYLPELIESVLAQGYPHYEHIVVDGGSSDGTHDILKRYSHLRWWVEEGSSAYEAQRAGMRAAAGDFIVMVNADDKLVTPDAFSSVVAYIQQHPEADLVYGWTLRMNAESEPLPANDFFWRPSLWLMRHVAYVQHCSLYVSRRLIIDQGIELDPHFVLAADWDWMTRLFEASQHTGYLKRPMSYFRIHMGQRSHHAKAGQWEQEKREICQRHGSSYTVKKLLTTFIIWRGMVLIALHTLVKHGPRAFLQQIGSWLLKRSRRLLGRST